MKRETAGDLFARALVAGLFFRLTVNLFNDFLRTGRITGLLLVASESLVVVLMVVRRPARLVDRSFAGRLVTAVSVIGAFLLRASPGPGLLSDRVTALMTCAGLLLVVVGKLTLRRSFGLVPANRGIVVAGPYMLVRHPIYTGYLITHLAFVLAYPQWRNIAVAICADGALIVRAMFEERILSRDTAYQSYCARVAWHLVPGVF